MGEPETSNRRAAPTVRQLLIRRLAADIGVEPTGVGLADPPASNSKSLLLNAEPSGAE
jgi:hypothetical protein